MNALDQCARCGARLSSDAPSGLCPRCLLAAGLESDADLAHDTGATTPHTPTSGSGSGRKFVPPTPEELAECFPKLEILGLVGAGGMGAVYKARQRELDRVVALKILPPQLGEDPAFAERFTREARAMARLSHPNIVGIYDFGRVAPPVPPGVGPGEGGGELCWLVMEFVDGANLRSVIRRGPVEPKEAVSILSQICDALEYAHHEGVVHRDIKPENVLIDKSGRVRIGDFGLAKIVLDAAHEVSLTGTAELLGTFRYMAPEQLERERRVDHRADIYALGIMLYELLTGEVPMGRYYPPSEKAKSDPRLDAVVLRALEREPDRRFQRASELKTALESLGAAPSTAGGLSTMTSRWTSGMWSGIWSTSTSRPAGAWVVGCRLLGMLVAFGGVMAACFLEWDGVRVELIDRPPGWSSYSATIAEQTSLGWQTLPGKLVAAAFGLILLHLMANLHRLRWLAPTYAAFFVCGFAAIALAAWCLARDPALSGGSIRWEASQWQQYLQAHSSTQAAPVAATPLEYLEMLDGRSGEAEKTAVSSNPMELIESLVERGKVSLSASYSAEGPYAGLGFGIALAFVGLLEFIFIYAAEPTRRLLGGMRSSVSSRISGRHAAVAEPRISKMAVLAALLGIFPMIPLLFLGMMAVETLGDANVDRESVVIGMGFLMGLSVFPTTVGLFAVYRVRRSRGMLHGLPLAYAAAITWPLIVFDVIVFTVACASTTDDEFAFPPLTIALILNVLAFAFGWIGVKKPLEPPVHHDVTP